LIGEQSENGEREGKKKRGSLISLSYLSY